MNSRGDNAVKPDNRPGKYVIHIDRKNYEVESSSLTGAEIRQLASLGSDVDLYREEHGDRDDVLIQDNDPVELKNGMHFFSTPRHITPGRV